jgi:hypothetical protein
MFASANGVAYPVSASFDEERGCVANPLLASEPSTMASFKDLSVAAPVWTRNLLGMSDDVEGLGQSGRIGRLRAPVGQHRLRGQTALHNLLG